MYTSIRKKRMPGGRMCVIASIVSAIALHTASAGIPQLPIGMNIQGLTYYTPGIMFVDVMTTASTMLTFHDGGGWNSGVIDSIPRDQNGYPLQIPYAVNGHEEKVRFLINNYYDGRYVVLYEGEGSLEVHGASSHGTTTHGNTYVDLNGQGGHVWIDIHQSTRGNHLRSIRILPQQYETRPDDAPLFLDAFVEGLEPFHAIRFMDWMHTNNSTQQQWEDRVTPSYYTQGGGNGICIEYAIALCNRLDADAWFCVPHMATDTYIRRFARLVHDSLQQHLRVYVEYSNEVWNWMFDQANYVLDNAPDHPDAYVSQDLAEINPASADHPEKDAYMMQRTFRVWNEAFDTPHRCIRMATGQHAWVDNTRRILTYLFARTPEGDPVSGGKYTTSTGAGCDMFSVAGYFSFGEDDHNTWLDMCENHGTVVSPEVIIDSVQQRYPETSNAWTLGTAAYVNAYDIDYTVYEGGQHMQPWHQGEYCYNQAVWDAQVHPDMYDMYMTNFATHTSDSVSCTLFMAFSYVGDRESRYGSWGHLESYDQLDEDLFQVAPKYQALLDANTPRNTGIAHSFKSRRDPRVDTESGIVTCDKGYIHVKGVHATHIRVDIVDVKGRVVFSGHKKVKQHTVTLTPLQTHAAGIYHLRVRTGTHCVTKRIVVR